LTLTLRIIEINMLVFDVWFWSDEKERRQVVVYFYFLIGFRLVLRYRNLDADFRVWVVLPFLFFATWNIYSIPRGEEEPVGKRRGNKRQAQESGRSTRTKTRRRRTGSRDKDKDKGQAQESGSTRNRKEEKKHRQDKGKGIEDRNQEQGYG
jgi:hypothetical protein